MKVNKCAYRNICHRKPKASIALQIEFATTPAKEFSVSTLNTNGTVNNWQRCENDTSNPLLHGSPEWTVC